MRTGWFLGLGASEWRGRLLVQGVTMTKGNHSGPLGDVYAASTTTDIAEIYDRWSTSYDDYMEQSGYRHPAVCVGLLARHVPAGALPVMDAGAGTGLIGGLMNIIGYQHIDGIDISAGMLDRAREKGVYRDLRVADLTKPLDVPESSYRAIISSGVFTTGHVGSEGLYNLLGLCQAGGHIVMTVKAPVWNDDVKHTVDRLETEGKVRLLEQTDPYVSIVGEADMIPGLAIVLERL